VPDDGDSSSSGKKQRPGFTKEEIDAVKAAGGKLTRAQLLRCRVRYFSDGIAIGSRAFVNDVFAHHREAFGPKRKEGAKSIRESQQSEALFSLRALKVRAVEKPKASGPLPDDDHRPK
jgi:hypothetical protein